MLIATLCFGNTTENKMTLNKIKSIGLLSLPIIGFWLLFAQDVGYIESAVTIGMSFLFSAIMYYIIIKAYDLWYN
jgi:hypothetical protein